MDTNVNTNTRFFNTNAAAVALMALSGIEVIDRELEEAGIVTSATSEEIDRVETYVKMQGITTQAHFAAVVINLTHGEGKKLDPDELTKAVADAFPNARVTDRHGPHYISHARKGRLKGLRENLPVIPHAQRKTSSGKSASVKPSQKAEAITVELLMENNDHDTLVEMAKGMGIKATSNWKTETVAAKLVAMITGTPEADESKADEPKGEDEAAA